MTGHFNLEEIAKVLQEYLTELDNQEDNLELFMLLHQHSICSPEAYSMFEEAVLARDVFYQHMAKHHTPKMKELLQVKLSMIQSNGQENIWQYLTDLADNKGITWYELLRKVGKNPKLAGKIKSGNWDIKGFSTEGLATICRIVEADPYKVLKLCARDLFWKNRTDEGGTAVGFRTNKLEFSSSDTTPVDNSSLEDLDYIRKLEDCLT